MAVLLVSGGPAPVDTSRADLSSGDDRRRDRASEPVRGAVGPLQGPGPATAGGPSSPAAPAAGPALRAGVSARPLGGQTLRTHVGARGTVRLEVRNDAAPPRLEVGNEAAPLRLLSATAEVPGVRFTPVVRPDGAELGPQERVEVELGFSIADCTWLRRTGRLVLVVEQAGVRQEVGLTVTHDREAGTVRQVSLDRVLSACPR